MAMARGGKTTKQQTRNNQRYNTAKDKLAAAQDKARQAAEKAQEKAQEKARQKEREKAQRFTEKQRAAEAQANAKNATARQRVNDYLREMSKPENQAANRPAGMSPAAARETAWSKAKASQPSTASGTVGLHGQNTPADVAKVQTDLVEQGVLDPKHVTGFPGTAMVDAIKAFQKKAGLKIDGTITPGGPTQLGLNAQAQAYQDMLSGVSMDEHGNWFDRHGNQIENPYQDENLWEVQGGERRWYENGVLHVEPDRSPPPRAPRHRQMTAYEAFAPLAKYVALRVIADGAPLVSNRLKAPAVKQAIDLASKTAGVLAESVKQNYLNTPQAQSKTKLKGIPAPKTETKAKPASEFTRRHQPPVPMDPGVEKIIERVKPKQTWGGWYDQHIENEKYK
ncbi:peptidoglycan-binding protein [Pseudomonadota bacterium]